MAKPSPGAKPPLRETPSRMGAKIGIALAGIIVAGVLAWSFLGAAPDKDGALGKAALEQVNKLVAFGPRPAASAAHQQMEKYIIGALQADGLQVEQDRFTADTPEGSLPMNNIIARHDGRSDRVLVLATHYDTLLAKNFRFVGANDGASGTGLLLALAPLIAKRTYNHAVWLVFLDGEEAFRQWSDTDSVYGSRHLAAEWKSNGIASRIGALILLDMIGDADLDIPRDNNSTPWLRDRVWGVAKKLGYSRNFLDTMAAYEDDHLPFIHVGIPAVDLLDLNYGFGNRYWHTTQDTADKLSAQSLQTVGEVTLAALDDLDGEK